MSDSRPNLISALGRSRGAIAYLTETATIILAAVLAYLLRFDFRIPEFYLRYVLLCIAVWLPIKLGLFRFFGLDRRLARYVSIHDLVRFAFGYLLADFLSLLVLVPLGQGRVPRSVYALDFLLCVMLTASLRVGIRFTSESKRVPGSPASRRRTLIYGAGDAGITLLRDLTHDPSAKYDVCGFIDDNPHKHGLVVHSLKVFGSGSDLESIARKHAVELVLIAIPSATGAQMERILEYCTAAGVTSKTVPALAEMIDGGGLARQIRDIAVEDLLGRTPVNLEHDRISAQLHGRTILVTGAAGSIGSEICRQLARFRPAAIVGYDIAESPLFNLSLDLARDFPGCSFYTEIGSIQNPARLREVFDRYSPSVVYHAAAYKHVPLMESHIFEAVENNVLGTLNVVEAARAGGVSEFVMISSDKAVRPASVMGATKRLAELLVRSLQPEGARYVSVRFGNVLGSNGSVVPIFKDQIARGGPVTVTHPEMRRYFMTIPEACQLVLQASTMGKGSEIFVLNMGEPVRIVDLARNLIRLSGLRPDHDIKIKFTIPRAGEKLYEELSEEAEDLLPTHHEKIRIFEGASRPWHELETCLRELRRCCARREVDGTIRNLTDAVPEYSAAVLVKTA